MEKKQTSKYKVVLETSGEKYVRTGQNINHALSSIPLEWNTIKAKGTVTVSKGNLSYTHLFYLQPLRRIFGNKLTMALWSKRLTVLLKASK